MAWSLLQFPAFTHLSYPPFPTLALWKNRTATARRKTIKPFPEMLTALWCLCTWKNQGISILLCPLDSQKWWAPSIQTMPATLGWRSDDKVTVWAILQNKSPFCQEENMYLSLNLISCPNLLFERIQKVHLSGNIWITLESRDDSGTRSQFLPLHNFSTVVVPISNETLIQTWSIWTVFWKYNGD